MQMPANGDIHLATALRMTEVRILERQNPDLELDDECPMCIEPRYTSAKVSRSMVE
jgi:hypothetical protein